MIVLASLLIAAGSCLLGQSAIERMAPAVHLTPRWWRRAWSALWAWACRTARALAARTAAAGREARLHLFSSRARKGTHRA